MAKYCAISILFLFNQYLFTNLFIISTDLSLAKTLNVLKSISSAPSEIGAQISSWGCYYELCMGRAIENLPAMCERLWTVKRVCSDEDFNKKHTNVVMKAARLISQSF